MADEAVAETSKRSAFYYGWRIVVLGYVLNLTTAGVGSSGFSVFVKPMADDLGWSRSSIVAAASLAMIAAAIFGHYIGTLLDERYGARLVTGVGSFVIGLMMIAAGQVQAIWQFLGVFFVAGIFGLQAFPAFIVPTIVSKWFVRKRGMALSFASMGLPSSGMLIAPYTNFLISSFDWRTAWTILGFTIWAVATPWCLLFMRSSPEDIGLRPDGDSNSLSDLEGDGHSLRAQAKDYPWTMREAIRTRAFWLILAANSLAMMAFLAILINFFAYATDDAQGFSSTEATIAFAVFSALSLTGKLPWAFLADRIDIRLSTAFTFALPGLAVILLLNAHSFWMLVLWGAVYGTGVSGISPLPALAWGDYYGRTFLGSIRGITSPVTFLTMAGAPVFAAWMYDVTDSYTLPFTLFLAVFLLCAVLMLFAKKPSIPEPRPAP